jgi:hypothetical protein
LLTTKVMNRLNVKKERKELEAGAGLIRSRKDKQSKGKMDIKDGKNMIGTRSKSVLCPATILGTALSNGPLWHIVTRRPQC